MNIVGSRELQLHRILAGRIKCVVDSKPIYVGTATPEHQVYAHELYNEVYQTSGFHGVLSEDEMLDLMVDLELWGKEDEVRIEEIPPLMDGAKVELYNAYTGFKDRERPRKILGKLRSEYSSLMNKRNLYYETTREGLASLAKSQYLLCASAQHYDGRYIWSENKINHVSQYIVSQLLAQYAEKVTPDGAIREIARTEPWKTMWYAAKSEGSCFGVPGISLSSEQRNLLNWSKFYDNIHENPECPPDVVVDDDDMLDGWAIIQRKKSADDKAKSLTDNTVGNKLGNANEVFVVVENPDDVARVNALNDPTARVGKRQKLNFIAQRGTVNEEELPEAQQELRMMANRQFSESVKS